MKRIIFLLIVLLFPLPRVFAQENMFGDTQVYHSFWARLETLSDSEKIFYSVNGEKIQFQLGLDFKYTSNTNGYFLTLEKQNFVVTNTHLKTSYIFDSRDMKLVSIIEPSWRQLQLYYHNWLLHYISDSVSASIFFQYDDTNHLTSIISSNGDELYFSYVQQDGKTYLTQTRYADEETNFYYDDSGEVYTSQKTIDFSLSTDDIYRVYQVSQTGAIYNTDVDMVYKRFWQRLFSLVDGKYIYEIDTERFSRKRVFTFSENLKDMYLSHQWNIYVLQGDTIKKYSVETDTFISIFTAKNITQFVIDTREENIYYISSISPWYFQYHISKKKLYSHETDTLIQSLMIRKEEILPIAYTSRKYFEIHPEFWEKYSLHFQKIRHILDWYKLSFTQKKKLVNILDKKVRNSIAPLWNTYAKSEFMYIATQIRNMILSE